MWIIKIKKIYDLIDGRDLKSLDFVFEKYEGRENVQKVTMDLSTTYKSTVKKHFPNAKIVADRFHIHRMFTRLVNKFRKKITGDDRKNPIRKLLLRNQADLDRDEKGALYYFLNIEKHRELKEVYEIKEAINRFYRINGHRRASKALIRILDRMGQSKIAKVITTRSPFLKPKVYDDEHPF